MEHVLSLSYGKDSLACLGAIEELGWPLDRIVHAEVWATDTIPADLPPMVEFKKKADQVIKERWGIEVEHIKGNNTFESCFYFKRGRTGRKTKFAGTIYGWPMQRGQWCLQQLKRPSFHAQKDSIQYVGIAADEPDRFHNLNETKKFPLVAVGWNEKRCRQWCEENGLLSPIYTTATRGGCWFCHNQGIEQLRILRKNYPELWKLMLKWDEDSPVTFYADGKTVHDFEKRFHAEDLKLIPTDQTFRWEMVIGDLRKNQLNLFDAGLI